MKTCAWCGHYCFDGEYTFGRVSGHMDYVSAFKTAASYLVFCCSSCRQAWENDFDEKWQQKKALEESEEERRREIDRREDDEKEKSEHTLRCEQCGRELAAEKNSFGSWGYPSHWNALGRQCTVYNDGSEDGVGVYCSNQCYQSAKASGLIARQLPQCTEMLRQSEAKKLQRTCDTCGKSYYLGTGYFIKKFLVNSFCSHDCAVNYKKLCGDPQGYYDCGCQNYVDLHKFWIDFNGWFLCSSQCVKKYKNFTKRTYGQADDVEGPFDINDYIEHEPAMDYRMGTSSKISFKNCTYNVSGSTCTIKSDRVNNESLWLTGNIFLSLWFCKEPYNGGTISGTCMANTDWLGQLKEGYGFPNINKTLNITGSADPGKYNAVVLAQEKHESGNNYIVGWVNFNEPVYWKIAAPASAAKTVTPVSSGTAASAAASVAGANVDDDADIFLAPEEHRAPKAAVDYRSGDSSNLSFKNCTYSVSDNKCTIKAERVDNDSSWRTGKIYLSLWFCKEPYNSGTINGTCMAKTAWLGQLKKGCGFTDINKKLKITGSVDPGKYNAVVTAQEKHESGKNNIVGWVNFDKTVYWKIADPTLAVESRSGAPSSLSIGGADFAWSKVEGTERTFSFNFVLKDIKNLSEWGTGKLFVDMWFCSKPYKDGSIDGAMVFKSLPVSFDDGGSGIDGSQSKSRAEFKATLEQDDSPATGTYHVLFVLNEQNADGSKKQVAFYNLEQPTDWKGLAMAPDGQMSSVTLQECKYTIKAGRLSITSSFANGSDWLTRQLSLDFYLCKTAGYSGGDIAGTLMASVPLGTLYPGSSGGGEHTVNITGKLKRGQYRALAVLSEDDGKGGKAQLSWKEFPQPQQW